MSEYKVEEVQLSKSQWRRLSEQGHAAVRHAQEVHGKVAGDKLDIDHIPTELGYECKLCGAKFPLRVYS